MGIFSKLTCRDPLRADTLRTMAAALTTARMRTGALRTVTEARKVTDMGTKLISHHRVRDSPCIHAHEHQV